MTKIFALAFVTLLAHLTAVSQSHSVWLAPAGLKNGSQEIQARNGGNCQRDSTLIFDYLMPTGGGQIEERILYEYGNNDELRRRFRRSANGTGPLVLFSADSTGFNADHLPVYDDSRQYLPNPATGETFDYLATRVLYSPCPINGNCVADSTVGFTSLLPGEPLSPSYKFVNRYDNLGRIQQTLNFSPKNDFSGFRPAERFDYVYDAATDRLNTVLQYIWVEPTGWTLAFQENYNYTPSGKLLSALRVNAGDNLPESRRIFSENNALRYTQVEFSYWNLGSGTWNPPIQTVRDYTDETSRPTAQVTYYNLLPTLKGVDSTRFEYLLNTDCLLAIRQYGAEDSAPLTLYRETLHFYKKSVSAFTPNATELNIYPNPASDWLTVENCDGNLIQISDLQGKIVHRQVARSEQEIVPLHQVQSGTYVLSVFLLSGSQVSRIVQIQR